MANKKNSRARQRRMRKARNCLLMLTLLALCACLVWAFVLKPSGPLNAYLQRHQPVPTSEPVATDAPTEAPVVTDAPTAVPVATDAPTEVPTAVPTEEPTPAPTAEPTPAPTPVDLELPYYIEVDRGMQVVRVYTIGEDGQYSLLVREMICSTDKYGYKPKDGVYELDGQKLPWMMSLIPDNHARYATRISKTILFHSATYSLLYPNMLNEDTYESLGQNVSAGCVRLPAADAKWIYDNVPAGTPVRFMSGNERDEALLERLAPPALVSGDWDPTDPDPDNPDYDPSYEASKPMVTPALGVTPAPTAEWTPSVHQTPAP